MSFTTDLNIIMRPKSVCIVPFGVLGRNKCSLSYSREITTTGVSSYIRMTACEYSDSPLVVKTKWNMEAEYIQSCNCDWGCPCNFDALPTHGNCEALVAYRVKKGKFGDTKLDGVVFAEGLWWPKAIHEGNGIGALYIDEKTTPEQRKAVEAIFSGKHGGGVFEIFPKTWAKKLPTKVVKVDFHYNGYNSWFKVDGIGEVHSTYITNATTGEKFKGQIVLPDGINWKKAMVTNIKKWWIGDREIHAKHDNRAGFVTTLKMTDKGCIG